MGTIYLIGFMGCGKSTIGNQFAESLSVTYKDTDQMVEQHQKRSIASIFATEGESSFRKYETIALKQTIGTQIVSTGGGIIKQTENIDFMKDHGIIIYLQTSFATINSRLKNDPSRPLWDSNDPTDKKHLFEQRLSTYERIADYIVETDNKPIDEIVEQIKNIFFHV